MRRPRWLRFDLSPLAHPVWWIALIVLAVNDHLLKGAGFAPGWLTGKLSDFAFLIVAPVLAAAALPIAIRRRRAIALVTVGGLFAAAKLSPAVSDQLVGLLRHLRIVWRLWPDPTDLIALAMLPVAGRLLRAAPGGLALLLPQRAGVLLGAIACAATSAPPRYPHNPFLLNAAPATESVQITWLLRKIPCDNFAHSDSPDASVVSADMATSLAASLTPGDLGDPIQVDLARGQVAALDGQPLPGVSPAGTCSASRANDWQCVGAVMEAPGAAPVLMVAQQSWEEEEGDGSGCGSAPPAPVSRCKPELDPTKDAGPDAVTLAEVSGQLQFVAGAKIQIAPIDLQALGGRTAPANSCRALRDRYLAFLQPQACVSDADCVGIAPPPIAPPPADSCGLPVTQAGAEALSSLETQWQTACVEVPLATCPVPQPAVCRAGACAAVCPGESIPGCPPPCPAGWTNIGGTACGSGSVWSCTQSGQVCTCANGKITCGPPQPVSATCPLTCLDYPGGGSYVNGGVVHPAPDAAPADAGPADAGARD